MTTSNRLKFSLDEPADSQEFAWGELQIRGWAIPSDAPISIVAKLGKAPWMEIPHGQPRPDVGIAYASDRNALHSGFSGRVPVGHLNPGSYDFTLQLRSATSDTTEVRRKIRISKPSPNSREAAASSSRDLLRIKLEEPAEQAVVLLGSVLRVTGWAIAKSGIAQVQIWVDGVGPHIAYYGLMREDIGSLYEEFANAPHSGFMWVGQTGHLSPGVHSLKIIATSKAQEAVQLTSSFQVDSRSEYQCWSSLNRLDGDRLLDLSAESDKLSYAPKVSIVTPVFKTPEAFLRRCIESVKKQVYPRWELILVDDGSGDLQLTALLGRLAAGEPRIRICTLPENLGIAGATNVGIALCTGEYVGLLDHDDELSSDALYAVVQALAKDPSLDVLYTDEDKIDEAGSHQDVFFKPDWSPDLLLSMNYVCHFLVCRRILLEQIGGIRLGFDGSQDFDLILRLSERTSKIHRIAKVLYHWRIHKNSTASRTDQKLTSSDAGRNALEQHLARLGIEGLVEEIGACRYRVKYKILGQPEVAIIIPTGGSPTLETALRSVLTSSAYGKYRIVVVDNSRQGVASTVEQFKGGLHSVELLDCTNLPFNFSLLCNKAARATNSQYLLFLNDDVSVDTPDWIESMLEHAQRAPVGAVGSRLLFPNGAIQHAGVVTGLLGVAGHSFRGLPDSPFYFAFPHIVRNCSAVTGACLMTRREVFESVAGFDEANLPTCFQDVDLCLKMLAQGYRIVYTPFAKLFHHESFSKKAIADLPEIKYMEQRWPTYISEDPYYNPNLTRRAEDYSLRYDSESLTQAKGA